MPLWKARADGSQAEQLASSPVTPIEPHWSPDNTRIAFMGQPPGERRRLYFESAMGGKPVQATIFPHDQGVPTWSRDGTHLVFGDIMQQKPVDEMLLHVLDLRQSRIQDLPKSNGLWTPRWSPSGDFIAAVSVDNRRLVVFKVSTGIWAELAVLRNIEYPAWTADSRYIHFSATSAPDMLPGGHMDRGLYRVEVSTGRVQRLADITYFAGIKPSWCGVTPDGTPLIAQEVSIEEIYALKLDYKMMR